MFVFSAIVWKMCRRKNLENILVDVNVDRDLNGSLLAFSIGIERDGEISRRLMGRWSLQKGVDGCWVPKGSVTGEEKGLVKERLCKENDSAMKLSSFLSPSPVISSRQRRLQSSYRSLSSLLDSLSTSQAAKTEDVERWPRGGEDWDGVVVCIYADFEPLWSGHAKKDCGEEDWLEVNDGSITLPDGIQARDSNSMVKSGSYRVRLLKFIKKSFWHASVLNSDEGTHSGHSLTSA